MGSVGTGTSSYVSHYKAQQKYREGLETAQKLADILNQNREDRPYTVRYDRLESGMTDILYRGVVIKTVSNQEIVPSLNVYDFNGTFEQRQEIDRRYRRR